MSGGRCPSPLAIRLAWGLALAALTGAATGQDPSCGRFSFRDAAAEAGLEFVHRTGATGEKHYPETMGAGAAWLDHDGDGWLDLYLVQSGVFPPEAGASNGSMLFRGLDGERFAPVPAVGALPRGYGQGVVAADLDGDGDQDLYLANYGDDRLLVNDGDGGFHDGTAAAELGLAGWSSAAAAADADGDGDLDLYVTRYVTFDPEEGIFCGDPAAGVRAYCGPQTFPSAGDRFYLNLGGGRFRDASREAGILPADGRGLGVVFTDLDDDGLPDLYVANDLGINFLFANRGDGSFEDLSLLSGAALNVAGRAEAGMGIAVGDVDGDLDPDLLVTHFTAETNTLYENLGEIFFADVSGASEFGPASRSRLGFGIVLADFDRDGLPDVYVANGHVYERPRRDNVTYPQPDQLLEGSPGGRFAAVACEVLDRRPTVARGLAAGDPDNDGDLDLVIQESGGPVRLLENGADSGGWLGARLVGRTPNTDAIGSRVVLTTAKGRQVRWTTAGDSYQSSSDRRVLFGRGDAAVESLDIRWPGGERWRLMAPPEDRYLVLPQTRAGVGD